MSRYGTPAGVKFWFWQIKLWFSSSFAIINLVWPWQSVKAILLGIFCSPAQSGVLPSCPCRPSRGGTRARLGFIVYSFGGEAMRLTLLKLEMSPDRSVSALGGQSMIRTFFLGGASQGTQRRFLEGI